MNTWEIIYTVLVLLLWVISGLLAMDLHEKKGYDGGFWLGFLLGIIGLIYSAGLPDLSSKKIIKEGNEQIIKPIDDEEESNKIQLCKNCGYQLFPEDEYCKNCGSKREEDIK